MPDWYYAKNGKQFGPVPASQLKTMAQAGELVPDDLVFQEGGTQWVAASTVKGLFDRPGGGSGPAPRAGGGVMGRGDYDRGPDDRDRGRDDYPPDDRGRSPQRSDAPPSGGSNFWVDLLMFRRLIAPTIIIILFWVNVAVSLIVGLVYGLLGLVALFNGQGVGLLLILGGIVEVPIGILVARLFCEMLILFFRMYEAQVSIKELLERNEKKKENG